MKHSKETSVFFLISCWNSLQERCPCRRLAGDGEGAQPVNRGCGRPNCRKCWVIMFLPYTKEPRHHFLLFFTWLALPSLQPLWLLALLLCCPVPSCPVLMAFSFFWMFCCVCMCSLQVLFLAQYCIPYWVCNLFFSSIIIPRSWNAMYGWA
jgi:hypothetical protein